MYTAWENNNSFETTTTTTTMEYGNHHFHSDHFLWEEQKYLAIYENLKETTTTMLNHSIYDKMI